MKLVSNPEVSRRLERGFFWLCVGGLVLGGLLQGRYIQVTAALSLLAVIMLAKRLAPSWLQPSSNIGNVVAPIVGIAILVVIALAWWLRAHGAQQ
jgi:hypothetical protein